jgi:hypothetical protein
MAASLTRPSEDIVVVTSENSHKFLSFVNINNMPIIYMYGKPTDIFIEDVIYIEF